MATIEMWHTLAMGEPPLVLLRSAERAVGRDGPSWAAPDERIAKIHVVSKSAGGEIRGYWLLRGALYLAYPVTPRDWPELDREVARVTRLSVIVEGRVGS